jgi:hypothetical protein
MAMETLSEALRRLGAAGYTDDYRAEGQGLRSQSNGVVHPPGLFVVDEVVRFEGDSDPSEESAVFALTLDIDGTKGTYTVTYGPMMDTLDADVVRRLQSRSG